VLNGETFPPHKVAPSISFVACPAIMQNFYASLMNKK